MACNFLTRLFRRRRQVPSAFSAPTLLASNDKHRAPLLEDLTTQEDTDFFYLGCLSEQGSYTLIVPEVPCHLDTSILCHRLRILPGCVSAAYTDIEGTADKTDLVLTFATAAEAAMALATQPPIDIGNGVRRNLRYADEHADLGERAAKRVKVSEPPAPLPTCKICSEEMKGAHSRPCFYCKSTWCYECLQNQFTASLDDQERFPAKCCGRVLHFDVAKSVIPQNDHTKYRTRFEQHNTTKPLYCAKPNCSAFLPPRLVKPNDKGQVSCPECKSTTCAECRVVVEFAEVQPHKCVAADEATALLKQFSYKRCPRCSGGVAKMYGCSHVRCQCGAHWCWDCQRPIQICWSKPCERAREDGDETDDYDIPEEETETETESEPEPNTITAATDQSGAEAANPAVLWGIIAQQPTVEAAAEAPEPQQVEAVLLSDAGLAETALSQPADQAPLIQPDLSATAADTQANVEVHTAAQSQAESTTHPTDTSTAVTTATEEPLINLDGGDVEDWEAGSFDFGDEPIDETWDTWGCLHHFNPIFSKTVWQTQKEWLPDTLPTAPTLPTPTKHIDCLKCYKTIALDEPLTEDLDKQKANGKERADSACDVNSIDRPLVSPLVASATETAISAGQPSKKNRKKGKHRGENPCLFNCPKCGVFYCVDCKKAVMKEISGLLANREYVD